MMQGQPRKNGEKVRLNGVGRGFVKHKRPIDRRNIKISKRKKEKSTKKNKNKTPKVN